MLDLNDPRWKTFKGGYQVPYDASIPLKELENAQDMAQVEKILDEFWRELHHQGDVNVASYMVLPHLIRIAKEKKLPQVDIPALVAVIEVQRHINSDPIPEEFEAEYEQEIKQIIDVIQLNQAGKLDKDYTTYAAAAIAAVNGQRQLAEVIMDLVEGDNLDQFEKFMEHYDEFEEWLEQNE